MISDDFLVHTFRVFHCYGARKNHLAPKVFRQRRHMRRDPPVFQRLPESRPYRARYQNRRQDKHDVDEVGFQHGKSYFRLRTGVKLRGPHEPRFLRENRRRRRRLARAYINVFAPREYEIKLKDPTAAVGYH